MQGGVSTWPYRAATVLAVLAVTLGANAPRVAAAEVSAPTVLTGEASPQPSPSAVPAPSSSPRLTAPPPGTLTLGDDAASTPAGVPVAVAYGVNDAVPAGAEAVTTLTTPPQRGSAELSGELLVYEPPASPGIVTLGYTTCIGAGTPICDAALVTVTVLAAEPAATPAPSAGGTTPPTASSDGGATLPPSCGGEHAWGGWSNGRIPRELLSPIGGSHVLEPNAAAAFLALRDAAAAEGVAIGLTDSYRSYEAQVEVRARKGGLVATATPGTSIHGWGRALDLDVGSPQVRTWLEANAPRFGWVNPAWARRAGKSFEPWHYEFYGPARGGGGGTCALLASVTLDGATPPASPGPETQGLDPIAFTGPSRGLRIAMTAAVLIAWQIAAAVLLRRVWQRRRSA